MEFETLKKIIFDVDDMLTEWNEETLVPDVYLKKVRKAIAE